MMDEDKAFIPYAEREALSQSLQGVLKQYEERMGFMPNALRLYMHRPEILSCLIKLNNTVMRDESSRLDIGLKRRIAAICSFTNKSRYCVAHNTSTLGNPENSDGEGWGLSEEEIAELLSPGYLPIDPVEKVAIEYAKAASTDHSNVPQSLLDDLADLMEPDEIVELACVVGFWAMYNSIHEALHVPIEEEVLGYKNRNQ